MPYEPMSEHTPSAMTGPPGPVIVTTQPDIGTPRGIPTAPQRVAILTPEAWAWITGGTNSVGSAISGLLKPLFKLFLMFVVVLAALYVHDCHGPIPWPNPPGPQPPVPPNPPNPPNPPSPDKVVNPRVLILYETAEVTKMPAAQQAVLQGKTVRDALDTKLPISPDGKTHNWRMWDYDVSAANEHKQWQDLMAKKPTKDKLPYVFIAGDNGVAYEGALPGTPEDFLTLMNKYVK